MERAASPVPARQALRAYCPQCLKPELLCVCAHLSPVQTATSVLILQHPQEKREILATAHITHLALPNSVLRIGLSWPNLGAALGKPASPSDWAVLYLGTIRDSAVRRACDGQLYIFDRRGKPCPAELSELSGIVVLDGNWRQAKALWWRNSWLLKLKRIVLSPSTPSLYGRLRREPRRESLSTIEAVALALAGIENNPAIQEALLKPFKHLITKCNNSRSGWFKMKL